MVIQRKLAQCCYCCYAEECRQSSLLIPSITYPAEVEGSQLMCPNDDGNPEEP